MTAGELLDWLEWQIAYVGPDIKITITSYDSNGEPAIKEATKKALVENDNTKENTIFLA